MNRNPLFALSLAAVLALSGCGAAKSFQAAGYASQAQALQALKRKKQADGPSTAANKDWKVVTGTVTELLPDDNNGSRHQHFLFKVGNKTIKTAHNIDLAPYVPVKVGDEIEVKCEYIKSKPYDVAHWTHYDPRGGEGGYIKLNGKVYDRLDEK